MSDEAIEAAVEQFLAETESALDSYDQGYADADATVSVLRTRIDELAAVVDEDEEKGAGDEGKGAGDEGKGAGDDGSENDDGAA